MYQKRFDEWNVFKQKVNEKKVITAIRAGEIRWIIFGVNIAREIDGKGEFFLRPALILHVIGNDLALVVPLTSKQKNIPGYVPFFANNRNGSLCLHQMKMLSQNRILHRIERIADSRLHEVQQHIMHFFDFKNDA